MKSANWWRRSGDTGGETGDAAEEEPGDSSWVSERWRESENQSARAQREILQSNAA